MPGSSIAMKEACCGSHEGGHSKVRLQGCAEEKIIYIPHFFKTHQPVEAVPFEEVDRLRRKGILTPCDGKVIYAYKGRGVATLCPDPAFLDVKLSLLQRNGNFALITEGGVGLKLDPKSSHYDPSALERIKKMLSVTADTYDLGQIILPFTHFPCLAENEDLSLEQAVEVFARGGTHIEQETGLKVIVTSLITTKCADRLELRWMHIKKIRSL